MSTANTGKTFVTSDIAIAAYLATHGFVLTECKREPGGRFYFEFNDPDSNARAKSVEFVSSDCCKFDNHIRNLKKLLYDS